MRCYQKEPPQYVMLICHDSETQYLLSEYGSYHSTALSPPALLVNRVFSGRSADDAQGVILKYRRRFNAFSYQEALIRFYITTDAIEL